jgi:hypothetical protein
MSHIIARQTTRSGLYPHSLWPGGQAVADNSCHREVTASFRGHRKQSHKNRLWEFPEAESVIEPERYPEKQRKRR